MGQKPNTIKTLTPLFICIAIAILGFACNNVPMAQPNPTQTVIVAEPTPAPLTTTKQIASGPPLPTVFSISAEDIVITDKLAEGLKFVYVETDGTIGESKIWVSSITALEKRMLLTTIPHKPKFGSGGAISTDGSKLFYIVIPPEASSKSIVEVGYNVWLFDIKAKTPLKMIEGVNGFVKWMPDNETIVYSRKINDVSTDTVKTNIYTMSSAKLEEVLVLSTDDFITPATFDNTNSLLYIDGHTLKAINLTSSQINVIREINVSGFWDAYTISPDGKKMVISSIDKETTTKQYNLTLVELDMGEMETLLTHPYEQGTSNSPRYRFSVRWLFDSKQFSLYIPPYLEEPAQLVLMDSNSKSVIQSILSNASFLNKTLNNPDIENYLLAANWSPDGEWLILKHNPNGEREMYLLDIKANKMTQIPSIKETNWIRPIGWIIG